MKLIRKCEQWLKLWATADASDEKVSTAQNQVKKALIQTYFTSLLCLVLCVTMFLGTTYAWFTSEVNNEGNEIYIGTLDVELEKLNKAFTDENDKWLSLSETDANGQNNTKLFDSGIRWEPGFTALETVRITNEGDLAFKYLLNFTDGVIANDANATEEDLTKVAKHFMVYVHAGELTDENKPASFADINKTNGWTEVGSLADILTDGIPVLSGEITDVRNGTATVKEAGAIPGPNDSKTTSSTYTIALHMNETATGEELMGRKISLNVKLVAYQKTQETDGFNNAGYDDVLFVATAEELQEALENASGETVIGLANDVTAELTVTQKEGVKTVIDGGGNQLTGSILVDGKSSGNDTAGLTIRNVNFVADDNVVDACIRLGDGTTNTRYTKQVTVSNCTFTNNSNKDIAAIKSYTGGDKNLTITGCTVNEGMHSLVQVANVENLIIENCKVYSKNGANVNQSPNVTISDCTFDVKGYAVRFGASSGGTGAAEKYLIENCKLKSAGEDGDAVIILRGTADYATLTLVNNTIEGKPINNTAGAIVINKMN